MDTSLDEYYSMLKTVLLNLGTTQIVGTPYWRLAEEILEMIRSYINDAEVFYHNGDQVNRLASCAYAHGWLDSGLFIGIITGSSPAMNLDTLSKTISSDLDLSDCTIEKTNRYKGMLTVALTAVKLAPVSGSPLTKDANKILKRVESCLISGNNQQEKENHQISLWWYSYGYGWLDLGVRAGLLKIMCYPELFTTEI